MSYTPVQNRFWSDGWVRQLNALDRYLFLYLLTNGRAGRVGVYELPLDLMASESGIDERDLKGSMLQRLEPRMVYKEGWVFIVNYPKYLIGDGPKFWAGVRNAFEELPEKIQALAKDSGYPMDRLSIDYSRFPNRIEENRIDISVAKAPLEVIEVSEDQVKQEKQPKYIKEYNILCNWMEKLTGVTFVDRRGQYKALKIARESDIAPTRLKARAEELWPKLEFKGMDWFDVVYSFNKRA